MVLALQFEETLEVIRQRTALQPRLGLVLGSGLGGLVEALEARTVIPYSDLPHWPQSTVHGHHGNLVIGRLEGQTLVVQQGRAHFYEGYTLPQVTFPIRVMHALGIQTIILTNAAGGLNPAYQTGDLMLLNDHINLVGMTGQNPLMGPNDDSLGPRFLGMGYTYDRALRQLARTIATEQNLPLHEGVYVGLSGPTFETPAEARMLRSWGADAVGMSTVNEAVAARYLGLRVMACSAITNQVAMTIDADSEANHEEVLAAGRVIAPRMIALLRGVLGRLTL